MSITDDIINRRTSLCAVMRRLSVGVALCAVLIVAPLPAFAQQVDEDEAAETSEEESTGLILSVDEEELEDADNTNNTNTNGNNFGDDENDARLGFIEPISGGVALRDVETPEPEGLRFGNFIVRPSLEIGLAATVDGSDTTISNGNNFGLLINSDWARHALEIDVNGTVPIVLSGENDNPAFDAAATLTLDVSRSTQLSLSGQYGYTTEDAQSSAFNLATGGGVTGTNEPATQLFAGEATLNHDFGGLTAQINATIGRLQYGAAKLSNGTSVSQDDLNSTDYDVSLRGGYALSGIVSPFVEVSYGRRVMDETVDSGGNNRNATRYGVAAGVVINSGEKLRGEIAVGYGVEKLDEASLADIAGITVDAEFNWSPMRGTNVAWALSTEIEPSGGDDTSGSVLYATELGLTHRIARNLTANAGLVASYEVFEGLGADEFTLGGTFGLAYDLNRYMSLTGRLGYEQTFSSDSDAAGSTASAFVGMRFQR